MFWEYPSHFSLRFTLKITRCSGFFCSFHPLLPDYIPFQPNPPLTKFRATNFNEVQNLFNYLFLCICWYTQSCNSQNCCEITLHCAISLAHNFATIDGGCACSVLLGRKKENRSRCWGLEFLVSTSLTHYSTIRDLAYFASFTCNYLVSYVWLHYLYYWKSV